MISHDMGLSLRSVVSGAAQHSTARASTRQPLSMPRQSLGIGSQELGLTPVAMAQLSR